MVQEFKMEMQNEFEMINLGDMSYFLDMEVHQTKQGIFINQEMLSKY